MNTEIECPACCGMVEYDTDNDTALCECGEIIFIEESDE